LAFVQCYDIIQIESKLSFKGGI